MMFDPLPSVQSVPYVAPAKPAPRCVECDRPVFGLVELIVHYELQHPTKAAA